MRMPAKIFTKIYMRHKSIFPRDFSEVLLGRTSYLEIFISDTRVQNFYINNSTTVI